MAFEPVVESDNNDIALKVKDALMMVEDPELHIDVWTLELIRKVVIEKNNVNVIMTLTTPFCPYGPSLIEEIKNSIAVIDNVDNVDINLTFDEPWKPSDDLKSYLGIPSYDE